MDLSMIKREAATEVVPYDLEKLMATYRAVKEAQDEVGGNIVYRAKLPKEGRSFLIDTGDEDNLLSVPTIEGVVVHSHLCNARFDPASRGEPPICSSMDAKVGIDVDGSATECEACPFNQFGTAGPGKKGKACKNMIRLYILTDSAPIPILLSLPPTSIKAWQNYRYGLALDQLTPKAVLTELSLVTAASKTSGDKFAKVKPKFKGVLSEDARRIAEMFSAGFTPKVEISEDDYEIKGDGEMNESDE